MPCMSAHVSALHYCTWHYLNEPTDQQWPLTNNGKPTPTRCRCTSSIVAPRARENDVWQVSDVLTGARPPRATVIAALTWATGAVPWSSVIAALTWATGAVPWSWRLRSQPTLHLETRKARSAGMPGPWPEPPRRVRSAHCFPRPVSYSRVMVGCTRWSDKCNTCFIDEGVIVGCTTDPCDDPGASAPLLCILRGASSSVV